MKNYLLTLIILSFAVLTGCKKNTEEMVNEDAVSNGGIMESKDASQTISGQFVPNELIVKFKKGTSEKNRTQALSFINARVFEHIITDAMETAGDKEGIYLINTNTDVFAAMARMKGESNIEYAEPNWIYTHTAVSNDTYYLNGSLWGMHGDGISPFANQYGSQADEAWAAGHTGASTVYVGVVDEGAMFNHDDLASNFWTNPFDAPNDGIDNDGNGYKDDVHGWDFTGNNNSTFDGTADDHGTHVSGTIGAVGGNGKGVAGVNWAVKIITAKFLGTSGGTTVNAIKAVDYITDLKTRHGLNIVATNNSWGGGGFAQSLQDAITRAGNANILFVAAAGNNGSNNNTSANYPSNYPNSNIIAVASITSSGGLSSFSNYGSTQVDIGAPGSGVYSTVPGTSGKGKKATITSAYASYSGTSMATPHVTGAAALYSSTHPGATAADIKAAILNSATPTASLAGKCVTGARLNVSGF